MGDAGAARTANVADASAQAGRRYGWAVPRCPHDPRRARQGRSRPGRHAIVDPCRRASVLRHARLHARRAPRIAPADRLCAAACRTARDHRGRHFAARPRRRPRRARQESAARIPHCPAQTRPVRRPVGRHLAAHPPAQHRFGLHRTGRATHEPGAILRPEEILVTPFQGLSHCLKRQHEREQLEAWFPVEQLTNVPRGQTAAGGWRRWADSPCSATATRSRCAYARNSKPVPTRSRSLTWHGERPSDCARLGPAPMWSPA